jgi:hypothetical protein
MAACGECHSLDSLAAIIMMRSTLSPSHGSLTMRMILSACALTMLCVAVATADDKKEKPEKKSGTITGEVTAKDKNWIEVKADGEEKARRYTPYWRGGNTGGFDKDVLKTIAEVKIGSRVQLEWEFNERPRAVKIEVLDTPKKEKN